MKERLSCTRTSKRNTAKRNKKRPVRRPAIRSTTYLYYAVSNGASRQYGEDDRVEGYGCSNIIPDPKTMSQINIFVNGVLQPSNLFHIRKGSIRFLSDDVPEKGVPILVQSIRLHH